MKTLIVEDNRTSAKILEINLQKHDYQTVVAQSGKQALEYLTTMPEIMLVITDIMMPEMDGFELCRNMQERPELKDVPVIFCTARADMEMVKKAAELGYKHYLLKPINEKQLMQKVHEAFKNVKPVLRDKNQIMRENNLDLRTYEEIIITFAGLLKDKIASIEQYVNEGNISKIPAIFVEISEDTSFIGAERVVDVIRRIIAKSEKDAPENIYPEYALLVRELKILQSVLSTQLPLKEKYKAWQNEMNKKKSIW